MTFTVDGMPATKGSTRSLRDRRSGVIRTLPSCRTLGAWTAAVQWRAKQVGVSCLPRPAAVAVVVRCTFPRPLREPRRVWHTAKPDVDKLLRAVLDALTGIAYDDDAQVVEARILKVPGRQATATITVTPADWVTATITDPRGAIR